MNVKRTLATVALASLLAMSVHAQAQQTAPSLQTEMDRMVEGGCRSVRWIAGVMGTAGAKVDQSIGVETSHRFVPVPGGLQ